MTYISVGGRKICDLLVARSAMASGVVGVMTIYVMIVASLNLLLGYWLGVSLAGEARETSSSGDSGQATAASIVMAASALTRHRPSEPLKQAIPPIAMTAESVSLPAGGSGFENAPTLDKEITEPAAIASQTDSLSELSGGLQSYREQLADIDSRVRTSVDEPDRDEAERCVAELKSSNEAYLASQEHAAALLNQLDADDPEISAAHNDLQHAIERQRQEIEAVNQNVGDIDFESDMAAGFQQLLEETAKVIESNYVLGEKLTAAAEKLGGPASDENESSPDRKLIVGRDQFEATLESWWQTNKDAGRSLTLALIEIDRFARINSSSGIAVGDGVLSAIGSLIGRSLRSDDLATRYSGGKYLVMLPDTPVQESTTAVERLRQTIEATRYLNHDAPLEVTVSCAVAEAAQEDTLFTLLDRVELTLRESKRYGNNCTYIYEENHPSPVTPPSFDITPRTLAI